jgi:ABC-2 type transport system ATP-binding protein
MSTLFNIEIKNFTKSYPNKVIHIRNISVKRKVTILMGENGSGKSTILKGILNLISYEGTISSNYAISYMPENPHFPLDITVNQFLINLYHTSSNDYDYHQFVVEYGLESKIHSYINTLSKGMKAKLNLIQCLMRNTDIYILDEPLNGLDEESVKNLIKHIKSSNKHFIITTHLKHTFSGLDKEIIHLK